MTRLTAFCIATLVTLPVSAQPNQATAGAPTAAAAASATPDSGSDSGSATPDPRSEAEITAAARATFEAAVNAYDRGDYVGAAKGFSNAYSLKPHPDVLLNLAQSERLANRPAVAANHFATYLADPTATDKATAQSALDELRPQVVELIVNGIEGQALLLNDEDVGSFPIGRPLFSMPGETKLQSAGEEKSVTTNPGQSLTVVFAPTDTAQQALAAPAPGASAPMDAGIRKPFGAWFVETPIAWVGAGVSAASIVTSIIAAETASRRFEAADDARGQIESQTNIDGVGPGACAVPVLTAEYDNACSVFNDKRNEGGRWSAASLATLLVGLAAAGGTVGYYFVDTDPSKSETAILTPVITDTYQGLSLWTQF